MRGEEILPVGKLPASLLASLLSNLRFDDRVVVRPAVGEDVAAIDFGDRYLVIKTDPITFTTEHQGWYLANVNANDIATAGAEPKWCVVTALLPENRTTQELAESVFKELSDALRELNVTLCGGHTEITYGLDRTILVGAMLGEVPKDRLVDKSSARPGDAVLMTKWVPIEGASIIARERGDDMKAAFSKEEIERAGRFLFDPGISVIKEAMAASRAARVHAMHDITEGGVVTGLVELAVSTGTGIKASADAIPVDELARRMCNHFQLDPLGTIASGSLLVAVAPEDEAGVLCAVRAAGVECGKVGTLTDRPGEHVIVDGGVEKPLPQFKRDEISKLFS